MQAVAQCHQKKIRHGDLKRENFVMLNGRIKVIDFGISADLERIQEGQEQMQWAKGKGTADYRSPEGFGEQAVRPLL